MPAFHELLRKLLVDSGHHALRLTIRGLRSAGNRPFILLEAEPFEVGEHGRLRLARAAFLIRVLDPDQEVASLLLRLQPGEESGARTAHVQ